MKVLIWILTFFIGTVINTLIGYATGIRAGGVLLYIVEYFIAKKLCESWDENHPTETSDTTEGSSSLNTATADTDPSTRFVCKKCGNYSTGWYQTCPHCGAVGAMEKNTAVAEPSLDNLPADQLTASSESEPEESVPLKPSSAIMFCRECGTKLLPDALFCPECGAKIVDDITPLPIADSTAAPASRALPSISDLNEAQTSAPAQPTVIPALPNNLSPILRRAFLLLEDEEWEKADSYLERVLDSEPENAYAYLGKLLIEVGADSIEKLPGHAEKVTISRNYKKALRYAEDNQLKSFLQQFKENS